MDSYQRGLAIVVLIGLLVLSVTFLMIQFVFRPAPTNYNECVLRGGDVFSEPTQGCIYQETGEKFYRARVITRVSFDDCVKNGGKIYYDQPLTKCTDPKTGLELVRRE